MSADSWAPGSLSAQSTGENEILLKARAADLNCQGAPVEARRQIANGFLTDVLGKPVEILSAVVKGFDGAYLSSVGFTDVCGGAAVEETQRLEMWGVSRSTQVAIFQRCRADNGGDLIKSEACRVKSIREDYETPHKKAFQIVKSYQDREVTYTVLANEKDPVFLNLRVGQKVTATLRLMSFTRTKATATLVSLATETTVLRCEKGHEYAPSSGYKFCPIDGLPVR